MVSATSLRAFVALVWGTVSQRARRLGLRPSGTSTPLSRQLPARSWRNSGTRAAGSSQLST
eukprot:7002819-Prymnesium_polylepis.1